MRYLGADIRITSRGDASPRSRGGSIENEKIYSYAAKVAGIERIVEKHNHDLALTVHKTQENNWVVVAINNTDKEIQDSLVFNNLHLAKVYRGRIDADGNIVIPAADAVVFELK